MVYVYQSTVFAERLKQDTVTIWTPSTGLIPCQV